MFYAATPQFSFLVANARSLIVIAFLALRPHDIMNFPLPLYYPDRIYSDGFSY